MARTRIDLNRFRKVYPQIKRSPSYFNQSNEVQTFKMSFNASISETLLIGEYTSAPVVVLGGEDNVNLWISSLVKTNNKWHVTVSASAEYTGDVHLHAHEAT
jgi:hypothetical protein